MLLGLKLAVVEAVLDLMFLASLLLKKDNMDWELFMKDVDL